MLTENYLPSLLVNWPWLALLLLALPFVTVAWKLNAYPTWYWMGLLGISFGLSLIAIIAPTVVMLLVIFVTLAALIVAFDLAVLLWSTRTGITVSRKIARTASLGVELPCVVTV